MNIELPSSPPKLIRQDGSAPFAISPNPSVVSPGDTTPSIARDLENYIAVTRSFLKFWNENGGLVTKWNNKGELTKTEYQTLLSFVTSLNEHFIADPANSLETKSVTYDSVIDSMLNDV